MCMPILRMRKMYVVHASNRLAVVVFCCVGDSRRTVPCVSPLPTHTYRTPLTFSLVFLTPGGQLGQTEYRRTSSNCLGRLCFLFILQQQQQQQQKQQQQKTARVAQK